MFKKLNKKGFTLAELLVVVAIIGVLVAISIPIFTSQLEKSRDAVSIANIRAAYAESQTAYLTGESGGNATVTLTNGAGTIAVANVAIKSETDNDWSGLAAELPFLGGTGEMSATDFNALDTGSTIKGNKTVTFTYNANGVITDIAIA